MTQPHSELTCRHNRTTPNPGCNKADIATSFSTRHRCVNRQRFAYAAALDEATDDACVSTYEDVVRRVCKKFGVSDFAFTACCVMKGSRMTAPKTGFSWMKSYIGSKMTAGSIGLKKLNKGRFCTRSLEKSYWFLKSSRGGSTGVEESALSGRNDAKRLLIDVENVEGESSAISW